MSGWARTFLVCHFSNGKYYDEKMFLEILPLTFDRKNETKDPWKFAGVSKHCCETSFDPATS